MLIYGNGNTSCYRPLSNPYDNNPCVSNKAFSLLFNCKENCLGEYDAKHFRYNFLKPNVFVDMDGTLLNLMGGIKQTLAKQGIDFYPENVASYEFDGKIGCTKEQVYWALNQPYTFLNATPYNYYYQVGDTPDSEKLLLKDIFDYMPKVSNLMAYTQVPPNKEIYNIRQAQIYEYIGKNAGSPYVGEKPVFVEPNKRVTFVIEDNLKNLRRWWEAGNHEIWFLLVDHAYNRACVTADEFDVYKPIFERTTRCVSGASAVYIAYQMCRALYKGWERYQ